MTKPGEKGRKLTPKQEAFVMEYMVDYNASQAAARAGYSAVNAGKIGYQLLEKNIIKEAIEAKKDEKDKRFVLTDAYIIEKWIQIIERCTQGEQVVNSIGIPTGEWKFDSNGANRALDSLAKIRGLFIERKELNITTEVEAAKAVLADPVIAAKAVEMFRLSKADGQVN